MKRVKTAVRLLNELDARATRLLLWGVGVSLLLLACSGAGMMLNINLWRSPDIRYITMMAVENAVSIFTLSIGAGMLMDYGIKKMSS